MERKVLDLKSLYSPVGENRRAEVSQLDLYVKKALEFVGDAETVVITGSAPTWIYLRTFYVLSISGKVKTLIYNSPRTGDVVIFGGD